MNKCIDMNRLVLNISKLKLGKKLELILMKNGVNYLTDLSTATESSLKIIPGIGYASARKILRAYKSYSDYLMLPDKPIVNQSIMQSTAQEIGLQVDMHPMIREADLSIKDKEIINLICKGYSQEKIFMLTRLSKRTLRHRLAMLKIEYLDRRPFLRIC